MDQRIDVVDAEHIGGFLRTQVDLMQLDVMRPRTVVDINPLAAQWSAINLSTDHLRLGAMARMSEVADNPDVQHHYPVIADVSLAASQQIRNMATLGGNPAAHPLQLSRRQLRCLQ
jgi:CO/xanthine dehydrogenase FAD-binding subunit